MQGRYTEKPFLVSGGGKKKSKNLLLYKQLRIRKKSGAGPSPPNTFNCDIPGLPTAEGNSSSRLRGEDKKKRKVFSPERKPARPGAASNTYGTRRSPPRETPQEHRRRPGAQRSLLCERRGGRTQFTATLKSPSLFGVGRRRRARCPSALAAQSPPPRGPAGLPFGRGGAARSQNAPAVRGKPKWRRAVAKRAVFKAGVGTLALTPVARPQDRGLCVLPVRGARRGGCPASARTRRGSAHGDVLGCFFLYEAVGTTEVTE